MSFSEDRLQSFSRITHDIYRASRKMPMHIFQAWVMPHLQQLIHFDSACWGRSTSSPGTDEAPTIRGYYLFNLPDTFVKDWEDTKEADHIACGASQTPYITFISGVNEPDLPAPLISLLERYQISQVICCVVEDPIIALNESGVLGESKLMDFLSLYRSKDEDPFDSEERMLLQCILPHISEAVNQCAKHLLESQRIEHLAEDHKTMAITDSRGILYEMEDAFKGLLGREYPDWEGLAIDERLLPSYDKTTKITVGEHISITSERVGELILIRLRQKSPIDDLSSREQLVACMFAEGKTYKDIANDLCRSPSTIRNHIQSIYLKLGVKNKAELAQILTATTPSS